MAGRRACYNISDLGRYKVDCLLSKVLNAAIIGSSSQLKFLCYLSFYYISSAFTKCYLKGEKCSSKSIVPEMGLISLPSECLFKHSLQIICNWFWLGSPTWIINNDQALDRHYLILIFFKLDLYS